MRGYIDAVTSSGLVEGWAYEEQCPLDPLVVSVVDSEKCKIAAGLANLYRNDLADANLAHGWCHFRLRAEKPVSVLKKSPLKLIDDKSAREIQSFRNVSYIETKEYLVDDILGIIENDPTVINSLDEIDGCEQIFDTFIKARGVDSFVRAAYIYVLERSIDCEGLILYGRLIRQGRLTAFAMLRTLAESDEYRSRPLTLISPIMSGFPFRLD